MFRDKADIYFINKYEKEIHGKFYKIHDPNIKFTREIWNLIIIQTNIESTRK